MLRAKAVWCCMIVVLMVGLSFGSQLSAVPKADIDFDVDVSVWWYEHPLNPEGPNYTPDIASPAYTVNLTSGQSIGTAIDNLPESGGTIILGSGNYAGNFNIIGKSNVHIIAPDGAQIDVSPRIVIASGPRSIDYGPYNLCFKQRDPQCLDEWVNRSENIYFKNITFDGGNSATRAVDIKTSDGVMFDNCIFQNIRDTGTGHGGLVNGHAGCDSVWFRECHFVGSQRWALYLDGGYGCGLIDCVVESNFRSGILWLCNEDFSMDWNGTGEFDKEEKRNMQYSVVYGTEFAGDLDTVVSATGNDLMVRNNTVGGSVNHFTFFNPKTSLINPDMRHYCYDIYVENNIVENVGIFAHFNTNLDDMFPEWDNKSRLGRYTVRGNRVTGSFGDTIRHTGIVDGPNIACGNCWSDAGCITDDTCTDLVPDTDPPTVPQSLTVTGVSGLSVALQWDASDDNYGVAGYYVYRDGESEPVGDVSDTGFEDSCLSFNTQYTYQVSAYDDAGNISALSQSVSVTTHRAGDLDGTGLVDMPDFELFVLDWLEQGPCLEADFNMDEIVNLKDFALMVGDYWTGPDSTPPTIPSNLTVVEEGDIYITLSWDASYDASGVGHYSVFRGGDLAGTTAQTSFTDAGLSTETSYTYFVTATDVAGNESDPSNSITATTVAAMNMLTNPSFEEGNDNWAIWQQGAGHLQVVSADTIAGVDAVDGDMIVMMDGNAVFQWGPEIQQPAANFLRPTHPNTTYRFSAWLKMENITSAEHTDQGVRLVIFEFNEQGSLINSSSTPWSEGQGTSDWKVMAVEHTTSSTQHGSVLVRIDAGEIRDGYAYWDLAELIVVD